MGILKMDQKSKETTLWTQIVQTTFCQILRQRRNLLGVLNVTIFAAREKTHKDVTFGLGLITILVGIIEAVSTALSSFFLGDAEAGDYSTRFTQLRVSRK